LNIYIRIILRNDLEYKMNNFYLLSFH